MAGERSSVPPIKGDYLLSSILFTLTGLATVIISIIATSGTALWWFAIPGAVIGFGVAVPQSMLIMRATLANAPVVHRAIRQTARDRLDAYARQLILVLIVAIGIFLARHKPGILYLIGAIQVFAGALSVYWWRLMVKLERERSGTYVRNRQGFLQTTIEFVPQER